MTSKQSKEVQKNLEELKKYFKSTDKIEELPANMGYILHIIKVTSDINIFIRVTSENQTKLNYEIRIMQGTSSRTKILANTPLNIVNFSIKNIEEGIIDAAERLCNYKSKTDYKAIFGSMKKLGVKKWMKLNSLKQKLK